MLEKKRRDVLFVTLTGAHNLLKQAAISLSTYW
jgi:hypothetical protein